MHALSEVEGLRLIDGAAGPLEVLVEPPRAADIGVNLVVCHPHPLHGGTMHNKVVHSLARAGRDFGMRVARFNFRGVGGSAGRHDEGRGEVDDLLAVIASLGSDRRLVLAGFSFGAWVTAQAAVRLAATGAAPAGVLLVAPPVHYLGFDALPEIGVPMLVVQGDDDDVVDPASVRDWCRVRQPQAEIVALPTGHFFHGCLPQLMEVAGQWWKRALSPPGSAQ